MHVLLVHVIRCACFGCVVFVLMLRRCIVFGVLIVMCYYCSLYVCVFIRF